MQPPHQQQYSGPPSSIEQQQQHQQHPAHGGETTGARPLPVPGVKKAMPLGVTAGGGLLVGVIAGLLMISGGGDAKADAPKEAKGPALAKAPTTYGDLAGTEPATKPETVTSAEPETKTADPSAATVAAADPTDDSQAKPPVAVVIPDPPKPEPIPEPTSVDLSFEVTGLDDGVEATITVDDDVVVGTSTGFLIAAGKTKQKAKIVVRAKGYRVFRKVLNVEADMEIDVAMRKRATGGSKPGKSGPGGLLDL
tara:strand:- start:84938 stop:85693 length:756 start_codon:yes stop_codon:yes gene_type:complete